MPVRFRPVHPAYKVCPPTEGGRKIFNDIGEWYALLLRPPETWGMHEVAAWAFMPKTQGGAGMETFARRLRVGCIDGRLLLDLQDSHMKVALHMEDPLERQQALQAIRDLKSLAQGIASGEVQVPGPPNPPPEPPKPSTKALLQAGLPVPKRIRKLPWDKDQSEIAAAAAAGMEGGGSEGAAAWAACSPRPGTSPAGRRVQYSQRERLLAEAQAAAHALAHPDSSPSRRLQPLVQDLLEVEQRRRRRQESQREGTQHLQQQHDVLGHAIRQQRLLQQLQRGTEADGDEEEQLVLPPFGSLDTPQALREQAMHDLAGLAQLRQEYDDTAARIRASHHHRHHHPQRKHQLQQHQELQQSGQQEEHRSSSTSLVGAVQPSEQDHISVASLGDALLSAAQEPRSPPPLQHDHRAHSQARGPRRSTSPTYRGCKSVNLHGGGPASPSRMFVGDAIGAAHMKRSEQLAARCDDDEGMGNRSKEGKRRVRRSRREGGGGGEGEDEGGGVRGSKEWMEMDDVMGTWEVDTQTISKRDQSQKPWGCVDPDPHTDSELQLHPGPTYTQHVHPSHGKTQHSTRSRTHRQVASEDSKALQQTRCRTHTAIRTQQHARQQPRLRPLSAVTTRELQPGGAYSTQVHEPQLPDVYHTRDAGAVRKVLEQGGSKHVQHTLKSMLAEDTVRHLYSCPPRTEHTGMGQSVCVAQELGLAERELALRLNKGIKAPKALYLASLVGGPQPSPELIQVRRPKSASAPHRDAVEETSEKEDASAGPVSSSFRAHKEAYKRSSERAAAVAAAAEKSETLDLNDQVRATLETLSAPYRYPPGPPGTGAYSFDTLYTTNPQGGSTKSAFGVAPTYHTTTPTAAVPVHPHAAQKEKGHGILGGVCLRYTGRKPAWDTRPEPPYILPGHTAESIGKTMTQRSAQRLAQDVHRGSRGNSRLHLASKAGDAHMVVEALRAERRRQRFEEQSAVTHSPPAYPATSQPFTEDVTALARAVAAAAAAAAADNSSKGDIPDRDQPHIDHVAPRTSQTRMIFQPRRVQHHDAGKPYPHALSCQCTAQNFRPETNFSFTTCCLRSRSASGTPRPSARRFSYSSPSFTHLQSSSKRPENKGAGGPSPLPGVLERNWVGEQPLHRAACSPEPALGIMRHLLNAGADVNAQEDVYGATPLHLVFRGNTNEGSSWNRHVAATCEGAARARLLLEEGHADPEIRDGRGNAALHLAITHEIGGHGCSSDPSEGQGKKGKMGLAEIVHLLVACGANIDGCNAMGRTPLILSAMKPHRHKEGTVDCSLQVLLREGANPNLGDSLGRTPLHYQILDVLAHRSLLEANQINHFKQASSNPKKDERGILWGVRALLNAKADPNAVDKQGITPLHLAAASGSLPLTRLLLRTKANPNTADQHGRTPLHLATSSGAPVEVAAALVEHGADAQMRDVNGLSPAALAQELNDYKKMYLFGVKPPPTEARTAATKPGSAATGFASSSAGLSAFNKGPDIIGGSAAAKGTGKNGTGGSRATAPTAPRGGMPALRAQQLRELESQRPELLVAPDPENVDVDMTASARRQQRMHAEGEKPQLKLFVATDGEGPGVRDQHQQKQEVPHSGDSRLVEQQQQQRQQGHEELLGQQHTQGGLEQVPLQQQQQQQQQQQLSAVPGQTAQDAAGPPNASTGAVNGQGRGAPVQQPPPAARPPEPHPPPPAAVPTAQPLGHPSTSHCQQESAKAGALQPLVDDIVLQAKLAGSASTAHPSSSHGQQDSTTQGAPQPLANDVVLQLKPALPVSEPSATDLLQDEGTTPWAMPPVQPPPQTSSQQGAAGIDTLLLHWAPEANSSASQAFQPQSTTPSTPKSGPDARPSTSAEAAAAAVPGASAAAQPSTSAEAAAAAAPSAAAAAQPSTSAEAAAAVAAVPSASAAPQSNTSAAAWPSTSAEAAAATAVPSASAAIQPSVSAAAQPAQVDMPAQVHVGPDVTQAKSSATLPATQSRLHVQSAIQSYNAPALGRTSPALSSPLLPASPPPATLVGFYTGKQHRRGQQEVVERGQQQGGQQEGMGMGIPLGQQQGGQQEGMGMGIPLGQQQGGQQEGMGMGIPLGQQQGGQQEGMGMGIPLGQQQGGQQEGMGMGIPLGQQQGGQQEGMGMGIPMGQQQGGRTTSKPSEEADIPVGQQQQRQQQQKEPTHHGQQLSGQEQQTESEKDVQHEQQQQNQQQEQKPAPHEQQQQNQQRPALHEQQQQQQQQQNQQQEQGPASHEQQQQQQQQGQDEPVHHEHTSCDASTPLTGEQHKEPHVDDSGNGLDASNYGDNDYYGNSDDLSAILVAPGSPSIRGGGSSPGHSSMAASTATAMALSVARSMRASQNPSQVQSDEDDGVF